MVTNARRLSHALVVGMGLLLVLPRNVAADPILYKSRSAFLAALERSVTDTYDSPGYQLADVRNAVDLHVHGDASMNSVLHETRYQSTTYRNTNLVFSMRSDGDWQYCGGCNGSFELSFQQTTVGTTRGIRGVGLDFANPGPGSAQLYHAVVHFSDGSTREFQLGRAGLADFRFFGLVSPVRIRSIYFGTAQGIASQRGTFVIDNLTVGDTPVPEPATMALVGGGLIVLARRMKARRSSSPRA